MSRPLRADARRNRDAILSAAREAFDVEGVLTSLDGIALRAGVGVATSTATSRPATTCSPP